MNNLFAFIDRLIELSIQNKLIEPRDEVYCRNRLLSLLNEEDYIRQEAISTDLYETLDGLCSVAIDKGLIEDVLYARDNFSSTLMDVFIPHPSSIEKTFYAYYKENPEKSTDYFYKLCQNANYIKTNRIAKNVSFKTTSPYGTLDITINLSKPEKDPKQIALEKSAPTNNYPKCLLCIENEGYEGTVKLPDRANHRTISLHLNNKEWRLQYSPYLYYNEHCILLLEKHEPMQLTKSTFTNLLEFVKMFPHYFIGSNADLPIVGGSILAHEHYQGGRYHFPIHNARTLFDFTLPSFPNIKMRALYWPLSTIELAGDSIEELVACSDYIYNTWQSYSDKDADIIAYTDHTRHNTVTPIARKQGSQYVIDIVLRNNRTSPKHPLGIFHPHEEVHHIKKENIGLIEVMGLAILPGRLLEEIDQIKDFITSKGNDVKDYHKPWAELLKTSYRKDQDVNLFMQQAIGDKFTKVLEDAGVFKLTPIGIEQFKHFTSSL